MLRTPLALGMIAAASVTPATSVEAMKCDGTRLRRLPDDRRQRLCVRATPRSRPLSGPPTRSAPSRSPVTKRSRPRSPPPNAWRMKEFTRARNAEINASMATYDATRAFAAARNKEIEKSIALSDAWRTKEFARARNAEINVSLAAYSANRELVAFAAARNAEAAEDRGRRREGSHARVRPRPQRRDRGCSCRQPFAS